MMTELDVVDRCVIALLQVDGRLSFAEISRYLALPEPTIRRRINRLLDEEAMQIVAVPNPHKIGYSIHAIIGQRVQPGKVKEVVARLKPLRQVRYIGITAGASDIVIEALFRNNEEFRDFLTETLGGVDGLIGTQTSYVLEVAKRSYKVGIAADLNGEDIDFDEQAVLERCQAALRQLGEDPSAE
jgi:Lrp/AsnC family transcriptional regulator for asnA, asnC and gidA